MQLHFHRRLLPARPARDKNDSAAAAGKGFDPGFQHPCTPTPHLRGLHTGCRRSHGRRKTDASLYLIRRIARGALDTPAAGRHADERRGDCVDTVHRPRARYGVDLRPHTSGRSTPGFDRTARTRTPHVRSFGRRTAAEPAPPQRPHTKRWTAPGAAGIKRGRIAPTGHRMPQARGRLAKSMPRAFALSQRKSGTIAEPSTSPSASIRIRTGGSAPALPIDRPCRSKWRRWHPLHDSRRSCSPSLQYPLRRLYK